MTRLATMPHIFTDVLANVVSAVSIARTINDMIKPYSTAVAPLVSRAHALKSFNIVVSLVPLSCNGPVTISLARLRQS